MSYTKHHLTHQFYPVSFCYSWDSFSGISLYRLAKNSNKLQWLSKQIEQYVTRLLHIVKFQTKWSETRSVVSDSVRPHGLQLTRLLCPWNSPGKNTGVGSHPFHQGTLPNPGIKSGSPSLQAAFLPSEPPGKPNLTLSLNIYYFTFMSTTLFSSLQREHVFSALVQSSVKHCLGVCPRFVF